MDAAPYPTAMGRSGAVFLGELGKDRPTAQPIFKRGVTAAAVLWVSSSDTEG